mgnify:CR=1 FL=1
MILFVSPHLDDAVFSAGALIARLARDHDVVVATVFTASMLAPMGFALACQTDKGIAPYIDYMALRRAEDERALDALGARPVWLDLPEAPHRGYETPAALFGPRHTTDDIAAVAAALAPLVAEADAVFGPSGYGDHVDHHLVRDALDSLGGAIAWLDLPYAIRAPRAPDAAPVLQPLAATPDDVNAKLTACAAYESQIGFQFGDIAAMRAALAAAPERFVAPRGIGKDITAIFDARID